MARTSDKSRARRRRVAHFLLIVLSFSLMFLGKADIAALRNAHMGTSDFLAPLIDIVSAPVVVLIPW